MPNIIEQQDLLKGLPDDRLSMLMQNPTGDIPPFLVAAEAQRRQSIREQFSGGPQESVVDTLTKQIASVPQNIQAPMQEPPQMPPPQMQAGVGALQQTARDGGLMRRFASLGYVRPSTDVNALAEDLANMTPEELEAKRLAESNERMRIANERRHILGGRGGIGTAAERQSLESIINGPFSFFYDPQERIDAAKKLVKMPTQEEMEQTLQTGEPAYKPGTSEPYRYGMSASDRSSSPGYKPRNEESGQNDTSEENQDAATKAALRKRLECVDDGAPIEPQQQGILRLPEECGRVTPCAKGIAEGIRKVGRRAALADAGARAGAGACDDGQRRECHERQLHVTLLREDFMRQAARFNRASKPDQEGFPRSALASAAADAPCHAPRCRCGICHAAAFHAQSSKPESLGACDSRPICCCFHLESLSKIGGNVRKSSRRIQSRAGTIL